RRLRAAPEPRGSGGLRIRRRYPPPGSNRLCSSLLIFGRKRCNSWGKPGVGGGERSARAAFIISVLKARRHGAAEQRVAPAGREPRALPDAARHHDLGLHAGRKIVSDRDHLAASIGIEPELLDRIAGIEMKDLVAGEAVQRGERRWGQQI